MTTTDQLNELQSRLDFVISDDYQAFLIFLAGTDAADPLGNDELIAWHGVSEPSTGTGTDDIEEETEDYWCADLANLFGIATFTEELTQGYGWSSKLLKHGYIIGRGYGGDAIIQASDGAVYWLHGDEWDDDFVDDMVDMETEDAVEEALGNWVADDFKSFYAMLCGIHGANPA